MPSPASNYMSEPPRFFPRVVLLLALWVGGGAPGLADGPGPLLQPPLPVPGGITLHPILTSISRQGDVTSVGWFGIRGPYQLQRAGTVSSAWTNVGQPSQTLTQSLRLSGPVGFLRVACLSVQNLASNQWMYLGREACLDCHPSIRHSWYPTTDPPPANCESCHGPGFYHAVNPSDPSWRPTNNPALYASASACPLCHQATATAWNGTAHAGALQALAANTHNAACLPCHTTGYGVPGGFQAAETTPQLGGVQCETCHGPAGGHVGNTSAVSARPYVTPSAEVCGGCHNATHHSTYDEWRGSPHGGVTPDAATQMLASGEAGMKSCGPCHSGAVRLALLAQLEKPAKPLPSASDASEFAVTCAVCHDPHQASSNPRQLRNPLYSTNYFSYSTAPGSSFAAQYNPTVQICGQCHNQRGAWWTDTASPPHRSPQYNLLVGKGGYDLGASPIATHGLRIGQQCVHCHTEQVPDPAGAAADSAYRRHQFEVRFDACAATNQAVSCHPSPENALGFLELTHEGIRQRLAELRGLLDSWATNRAPAALRNKYGALAWEYTSPGDV